MSTQALALYYGGSKKRGELVARARPGFLRAWELGVSLTGVALILGLLLVWATRVPCHWDLGQQVAEGCLLKAVSLKGQILS